ncbi:MAG: lysophospholipid acyltransferase family protein [Candidatus Tectomicrobia bacterium]|uniref:Lysophospholipid acyltransferase family protein n=1 Tax=Tectimicrobiota bacterium TaxID=2528274 RepID=A0A932MLK9_UNCTE|nr:lysophospholipid acyltransferase family protein [Candidatus Tectomicrobia bacterium]
MTAAGKAGDPRFDARGCNPNAPLLIRLAASSLAGYLRFVSATARVEILEPGFHAGVLASPGGAYIGVFWHRNLSLPYMFYRESVPRACLVSRSRDGELLARIVVSLNSRAVRGSSSGAGGRSKGGAAALLGLKRAIEEGFHLVITPDGPKGPPERLKPGAILLAAMTGLPVVPLGLAASWYFRLPTWDGTIVPLPFSRFVLSYGEPLRVTDHGDAAIEAGRAELERRLWEAEARAWARLNRTGPR